MNEALKKAIDEQLENMSREDLIEVLERLLPDVVVQRAKKALDEYVANLKRPESPFNPYTEKYVTEIKLVMEDKVTSTDDQQSTVADNQVVMHLLIALGKDPSVLTTGR